MDKHRPQVIGADRGGKLIPSYAAKSALRSAGQNLDALHGNDRARQLVPHTDFMRCDEVGEAQSGNNPSENI